MIVCCFTSLSILFKSYQDNIFPVNTELSDTLIFAEYLWNPRMCQTFWCRITKIIFWTPLSFWSLYLLIQNILILVRWKANCANPIQILYCMASDLGLHCLFRPVCVNTSGKHCKLIISFSKLLIYTHKALSILVADNITCIISIRLGISYESSA